MKVLFVSLLILGVSQGLEIVNLIEKSENVSFKVYEVSDQSRSLGRPDIYHIIARGPPYSLQVVWQTVPSPPLNPIRGYEVTLWEQQTEKVEVLEEVDGELQVVDEIEVLKPMPPTSVIPNWTPRDNLRLSSTRNFAEFFNLKVDFYYEIRVRAFTSDEVGEYSPSTRSIFCGSSCDTS